MVILTDRPDMTLDVYRGRKTTMQQQQCRCSQSDQTGPLAVWAQLFKTNDVVS